MSVKANVLFVFVCLMSVTIVEAQKAEKNKAIPDKNIERIVGAWKIQKIVSGKTEVAKNPTSGQWIEFRTDGKYVNKATALDSGSYRLNENSSTLYLESQVASTNGKDQAKSIAEWLITFQDETMTMQQKQKDKKSRADAMKYVYVRIADGSNALNN